MQQALGALEPLDPDERRRAMTWLGETLDVELSPSDNGGSGSSASGGSGGQSGEEGGSGPVDDPKKFMAGKEPTTDVERLTCLAYFLTKVRKVQSFKTADLTALNTEAAGHRFSNAATTAKNAVNQNGYLAQAGGGSRQVTALGEKVVEAMPDRDAVKDVLAKAPRRRRRSGSRKSKASK